jgi:serine/threonine-protein kinase HipA
MQSLAAMAHYDFNSAGAYSYEQAFETMRLLGLPQTAMDQQFLRMVFNIVARNHDDHVKNIAFLMDQSGAWSLSPAFDVSYSYNPGGLWTSQHQMSCNGKRDGFTHADLMACARIASVKASRARDMIGRTLDAVRAWPSFAAQAGVDKDWTAQIAKTVRLNLPNS